MTSERQLNTSQPFLVDVVGPVGPDSVALNSLASRDLDQPFLASKSWDLCPRDGKQLRKSIGQGPWHGSRRICRVLGDEDFSPVRISQAKTTSVPKIMMAAFCRELGQTGSGWGPSVDCPSDLPCAPIGGTALSLSEPRFRLG